MIIPESRGAKLTLCPRPELDKRVGGKASSRASGSSGGVVRGCRPSGYLLQQRWQKQQWLWAK